jgi:two-component system LytT family sensor kinase
MARVSEHNKWLFKYKILHIPLWCLVWLSTFTAYYTKTDPLLPQLCNAGMVVLTSMMPFYITAHLLIPNYLYQRRYFIFIALLLAVVIGGGVVMLITVRSIDHFFNPSKEIISGNPVKLKFDINIFTWTSLLAAFGSGGLKIMIDSFRLRRRLYEVEKEKISTELNFLRSQINPHFLFNVINTIYFQIDKKNTDARSSVEKLSEMLRYQLYECTSDKIEIKKELDYIKNYVAVQTLRMEKGSDIQLHIDEKIGNFKIAPLLILPIVENAFKHVSNFKEVSSNKIYIMLARADHKNFVVETTNTYDQSNGTNLLFQSGGLGVQNLKRRLELLYPNQHELEVSQDDGLYKTTLRIQYEN